MKIGKVKRVIKNVPKPVIIRNWPKPKPIPVENPKKKEEVTK
jgi:hypothetical protein